MQRNYEIQITRDCFGYINEQFINVKQRDWCVYTWIRYRAHLIPFFVHSNHKKHIKFYFMFISQKFTQNRQRENSVKFKNYLIDTMAGWMHSIKMFPAFELCALSLSFFDRRSEQSLRIMNLLLSRFRSELNSEAFISSVCVRAFWLWR